MSRTRRTTWSMPRMLITAGLLRFVRAAAHAAGRLAGLLVLDPDLQAVARLPGLDEVGAARLADQPKVGGHRGARAPVSQLQSVLAGKHVDRLRTRRGAEDALAEAERLLAVHLLDVDPLAGEGAAAQVDPRDHMLRRRERRSRVELGHRRRGAAGERDDGEKYGDASHELPLIGYCSGSRMKG